MGRIDDVINVAGHRMSIGELEAVLAAHPAVAECAVIGVADEIKRQVPRGLIVLKAGASAGPGAASPNRRCEGETRHHHRRAVPPRQGGVAERGR
ncbi:MAG: AMP-binding enzyme [Mycobacterium sp.]